MSRPGDNLRLKVVKAPRPARAQAIPLRAARLGLGSLAAAPLRMVPPGLGSLAAEHSAWGILQSWVEDSRRPPGLG